MSKEPLFVAFASQKGGVGKTAVTILAASHLHYVMGFNVAVIDCDFPQHSIWQMREREAKLTMEDPHIKKLAHDHFRKIGKRAYPVIAAKASEAIDAAERLIRERDDPFDIIFFDLPGTLKSTGVVETLSSMDYIFSPISADRLVLESTIQMLTLFQQNLITTGIAKTKGLHLFWTMVDAREKTTLYGIYEDIIAQMGLTILKTSLPEGKRFRRELSAEHKPIFRSTLFPIDRRMVKSSRVGELMGEICSIIKQE